MATHKELDLRKKKVLDRDLVAARKNAERIRRDMEKSIELDVCTLCFRHKTCRVVCVHLFSFSLWLWIIYS